MSLSMLWQESYVSSLATKLLIKQSHLQWVRISSVCCQDSGLLHGHGVLWHLGNPVLCVKKTNELCMWSHSQEYHRHRCLSTVGSLFSLGGDIKCDVELDVPIVLGTWTLGLQVVVGGLEALLCWRKYVTRGRLWNSQSAASCLRLIQDKKSCLAAPATKP